PKGRRVADADTFDLVRPCGRTEQHRRFGRLDSDNPHARLVPLEHGRDAARRSGRTDAMNEGTDLTPRLAPDLLTEPEVTRDAVLVLELVGPIGVRLLAQPTSGLDHVEDELLRREAALARYEREICTERRHLIQLLGAERVGADDVEAISLGGADER